MIKRKILISLCDSSKYYLGMADLLLKYNIPAIFYIFPKMSELSDSQIKCLSGIGSCPFSKKAKSLFEIGVYIYLYCEELKELNEDRLVKEIKEAKTYLEKIIEKPITKFCYPEGGCNEKIKEKVKLLGFKEARTNKLLDISFPKNLFEINPTIEISPLKKEYKDKTWIEIGYELFDEVIQKGGRFELFGNAYEVLEKYNMRPFVDDFLAYMDNQMKRINYKRRI